MNTRECQQLIEDYVNWLHRGLSAEPVNGACELTTPFLDRHNDHLQVYAIKKDSSFVLTDDGYILADLEASGFEVNTPKRKHVIDSILNGVGVRREGDQLRIEASQRNVGQKLHSLVQAMLAVNDMFVLAQSRVASFFWEDVRAYLDFHGVRYSPRVKIAGKSGYDHAIDFLIPRSSQRPERFLQTINAPSKNTIGAYLFTLTDTREARGSGSEAYAFLNDAERSIGGDVIDALDVYGVKPALWSDREKYAEALAS